MKEKDKKAIRTICKKIKVSMIMHDITQKDLAEKTGIDPGVISLMLSGKRVVSYLLFLKVIKHIPLDIRQIMEKDLK